MIIELWMKGKIFSSYESDIDPKIGEKIFHVDTGIDNKESSPPTVTSLIVEEVTHLVCRQKAVFGVLFYSSRILVEAVLTTPSSVLHSPYI